MARYTGPICKNCRRFGMKLCSKPAGKCAWERRKSAPGDKSTQQRRRRISEYGTQLREKQKAQFMVCWNDSSETTTGKQLDLRV